MGGHIDTVETGLLHRSGQFHRTVFQHHIFLHILIHLRTCLVVDVYIVKQCAGFQHVDHECGLLTHLVGPVLMVRLYRHHDTVSTNLCRQRTRRHQAEE